MKEQLDPFYISKIAVTYFQDTPKKGCMYCNLVIKDNYPYFEGTDKELENFVIEKMKISSETDSLKFVTVYGFDRIDNRNTHLELLLENCQGELDGEEDFFDQEEECYSFYFDHRKTQHTSAVKLTN